MIDDGPTENAKEQNKNNIFDYESFMICELIYFIIIIFNMY